MFFGMLGMGLLFMHSILKNLQIVITTARSSL